MSDEDRVRAKYPLAEAKEEEAIFELGRADTEAEAWADAASKL